MDPLFTPSARRLGIVSGYGGAALIVVYVGVLVAGLVTLRSPLDPIGDPWFTLLEVLIIVMMPVLVTLMIAVHAWAERDAKVFTQAAAIFMSVVAALTSVVHFEILTLSRQPAFVRLEQLPLFLAFQWPSVVYSLDILAWDVFFPLSVLAAAFAFRGGGLQAWIRWLLIASGALSLAGLIGAATGDMQVRNIGIVGYAGVFPIPAALIALLFSRQAARPAEGQRG